MELIKLKLQGPSLARVLSGRRDPGRGPIVFNHNFVFFYLKRLVSVIQALGPTKLESATKSTILFQTRSSHSSSILTSHHPMENLVEHFLLLSIIHQPNSQCFPSLESHFFFLKRASSVGGRQLPATQQNVLIFPLASHI